jgi:hypothetical protein
MEKTLKEILDEILDEIEQELDEATTTAGVDGYQTPFAFGAGRKKDKKKEKDVATQAGYTIAESVNEKADPKKFRKGFVRGDVIVNDDNSRYVIVAQRGKQFIVGDNGERRESLPGGKVGKKKLKGNLSLKDVLGESINEAKAKRPVNRWLELKNDESMHPHKKMAMGLKELKYQLREVEKFFNWYNKIKTMNELDSQNYWKRTNKHIYTIKEKLIKIAKTIQEIEK